MFLNESFKGLKLPPKLGCFFKQLDKSEIEQGNLLASKFLHDVWKSWWKLATTLKYMQNKCEQFQQGWVAFDRDK